MSNTPGDNFEVVYADGLWLSDDVPERVLALVLLALMVRGGGA